MMSGFQGEGIRHGRHHLAFSSSHRCVGRIRCRAAGSPPAIWDRFTTSLLDLSDADVVAAGFNLSFAYVSGHLDVSALWHSNQMAERRDGDGDVNRSAS
jgi:hypothetical protein